MHENDEYGEGHDLSWGIVDIVGWKQYVCQLRPVASCLVQLGIVYVASKVFIQFGVPRLTEQLRRNFCDYFLQLTLKSNILNQPSPKTMAKTKPQPAKNDDGSLPSLVLSSITLFFAVTSFYKLILSSYQQDPLVPPQTKSPILCYRYHQQSPQYNH
jgi:hypothetical protein